MAPRKDAGVYPVAGGSAEGGENHYQEELQNLVGIELPEDDYESIDEETKAEIAEKLEKSEEVYKRLIETFEEKELN